MLWLGCILSCYLVAKCFKDVMFSVKAKLLHTHSYARVKSFQINRKVSSTHIQKENTKIQISHILKAQKSETLS